MEVDLATMKVRHGSDEFDFRFNAKAREEVQQILQGRIYPKVSFLGDSLTIVDVGASIGAAATYFAANYPNSSVFGFEPHKQSFDLAVANTNGAKLVHLFNYGLHEEDQTAQLYLGEKIHITNSIFSNAPYNSTRTDTVQLRKGSKALTELGVTKIDVLKVDTEGCEVPILRDLLSVFAPKVIHLEYHNEPDRRQLDDMLASHYILVQSMADRPHIGVVTYVRQDAFPSDHSRDKWAVGL